MNKITKKLGVLFTAMLLSIGILTGCESKTEDNGKINVVCTVFPQYDWTKNIIGTADENIELTLLLNNGTDIHSYQPTTQDIVKISSCDVFIYTGGESEEWVEDILKEAKNKDMKVVNLMEMLGESALEEMVVEGMQKAEEEEHEHEGTAYDEHIWLSLKNAKKLCNGITEVLTQVDEQSSSVFEENCAAYVEKLQNLDKDFTEFVDKQKNLTVLFGDRFPFLYLMEDYDISYYAAFPGCSADTEASFETIAFLSGKMNEHELPCVFVLESSDQSVAKTIIKNTENKKQSIQVLDSMQSVTAKDIENGTTYLSLMEKNMEVLKMGA